MYMIYPSNYSDIVTGRSSLDDFVKNHWPEFYAYINNTYKDALNTKERLYMFYNNISERPVCKHCGKPVKFHGPKYGFTLYCGPKCSMLHGESVIKQQESKRKKYGDDFNHVIAEKGEKTKILRYGDPHYCNKEKAKQTMIAKYGVDNPMKNKEIQDKSKQTCLERYGSEYLLTSNYFLRNKEKYIAKSQQTCVEKYGVKTAMHLDDVKNRVKNTCKERYGVEWNCMRQEAHNSKNKNSVNNENFAKLLDENNIQYEREFTLNNRSYDFKIGSILIEINPTPTHNINWNPFSKTNHIKKSYHFEKSQLAFKNDYRCIHVWDWDDKNKIIELLKDKETIYARKCELKEPTKYETNLFLNENHLQGTCKGQTDRIGLYYNNELIQVMTFGKPRYNKKYEYELLRLCTKNGYKVVGGAERCFKHFVDDKNPETIISYCDFSKFSGDIYITLGFTKNKNTNPSCHWYNIKTKKHITNNLLIAKGYDNLFGTSYGKGSSNEELMLNNKWLQVYDAGQLTFVWKNIFNND